MHDSTSIRVRSDIKAKIWLLMQWESQMHLHLAWYLWGLH